MRFIQLSTYTIPKLPDTNSPDTEKLFPFLHENDEATQYSLAFLVAKSNKMLQLCLEHLGFQIAEIEFPQELELPTDWCFMYCGEDGPFDALTREDTGDEKNIILSPYLTITLKELTDASVVRPKGIEINKAKVTDEQFFRPSKLWKRIKGLHVDSVSKWLFQWADKDGDTETRINFEIPIVTQGDLKNLQLGFSFVFSGIQEEGATTEEYWNTGTLKARDVPIVGGVTERLYIGDAAFETNLPARSNSSVLSYEADPKTSLKLTGINFLELEVDIGFLYVRFSEDGVAVHSYESTTGSPMRLSLSLKFPLIMGPIGSSSSALPLMVPLIDKVIDEAIEEANQLFNFKLDLNIGEQWMANEQSILEYTSAGKWKISSELLAAAKQYGWGIITEQLNDNFLTLGGFDWGLNDLLGDAFGSANFSIGPDPFTPINVTQLEPKEKEKNEPSENFTLKIPMMLFIAIGPNQVQFTLDLRLNLETFRLSANRLSFRSMPSVEGGGLQVIDLVVMAIFLPNRITKLGQKVNDKDAEPPADGYFDFEKREFVLIADVADENPPVKPTIAIPGNLNNGDLSQRLLFELVPFSPDSWPKDSNNKVYLRINPEGLSLYAKVLTSHHPNVLKQADNRRPLGITPLAERDGKASEIVIIDNTIRKAVLYGELEVPGVDDLLAKVEIGMRQDKRGKPPIIHAAVDLDKTNGKPLANFSAGYLQIQIDDMRARLEWNLAKDEWSLSVPVDASFMLSSEISKTGGLDDLRDPNVIKVRDLDLMNIHKGFGEISLPMPDVANFTCLDGLFSVSLKNLRFGWGKSFVLECDEAEFAYLDPGTLQVSVEVGGVYLEFSGGDQIKMRNPERIGIDVSVGDSVRFRGAVAWVDNDRERYFAAAGTVAIEGLPEAKALVKIGTGRKENGQIVPNIVLYGSMDYEVPLFSGVVAKNFGAGIGINNRLTGVDERPNAEKLLANIDSIDPSRISGWKFVERNGFYLSIVGTTIIASNNGGNSTQNVYIASLLLSIDVDLNIIAAGKVWFASSVDYVRKRENWSRPALKGAIAILPRDQLFTAALESFPNPAIEANEQLEKILNNGHIKLSFLLSPSLVDFYLQDLSYRSEFLGIDMLYRGSMRLAIFKGTVLMRADQMITGSFSRTMEAGPGGFSCRGDVSVAVLFGGLLSSSGLAAYGMIAIQIALEVAAWIVIGFSFTIGWGRWKKRISFTKTFRLPSTRLDIGLRGAIAFNESGDFGFAGELSISVSICGYRLSISPSLKIREEVIVGVRRRVAVFEKNLDAYREKLLAGDGSSEMADSKPTWLHYQIQSDKQDEDGKRIYWHLLVPSSDAKWFVPKASKPEPNQSPFSDYVTSIKINDFELKMPWDRSSWDERPDISFQNVKEQLEEVEATMVETAVIDGDTEPTIQPLQNYKIITDPRIDSVSREFWSDIDQALLPDHALPVRMKTAEQVLQSGGIPQDFNSTYGRLINFLYWSRRAVVERRHSGHDLLPEEELEQKRAVVLYQLLQELKEVSRNPEKKQDSPWVATTDNDWQGLIFSTKKSQGEETEWDTKEITVNRENGSTQTCKVRDAATEAISMRATVRLQLPRQEYVVDKESDEQEEGRVIVRLPLRYDDKFFHEYLPVFDHFEVWRRIRGQSSPVRVGSYQLPSLTYLPGEPGEKPVLVVDPYIFSDEFRVRRKDGETPQFDIGVLADRTVIEYAVKLIPIGSSAEQNNDSKTLTGWQPVRLHVPEPDTFPIDLAMVFDVHALYRPTDPNDDKSTWTYFQLASMGDKRITLALTDEWDRQKDNNKAGEPVRPFQIWAEERPIVDAGFYAGSADEARESSSGGSEQEPANMTAEQPVITLQDKFQIAVVPVVDKPGTWKFQETNPLTREGYAYRFYIRPVFVGASGRQTEGTLRPLGLMISKSILSVENEKYLEDNKLSKDVFLPQNEEKYFWYEDLKGVIHPAAPSGRTVRQIEWIAKKEVDAVTALYAPDKNKQEDSSESAEATKKINFLSASVRPLERNEKYPADKLRRRIGISWNRAGQLGGGVDIQIHDRDDTAVAARFTCETKEYTAYQHSIHNFSNDSAWRLTRRERALRFKLSPPVVSLPDSSDLPNIVDQMLYLDTDNPILKDLRLTADQLTEALGDDKNDPKAWGSVAAKASKLIKAIEEFEKSPLNLNDQPLQTVILQIEALIRYLFLGLKDDAKDLSDLTADRIAAIDSNLRNMLLAIDELNPQAADFEDSESGAEKARQALLNKDYSRKLAAIIRRRMVIGEDVLAGTGDGLPLAATEKNQPSHWLPRGVVFEEIRKKHDQESTSFPNVKGLLDMFPAEAKKTPDWSSKFLKEAIEELNRLVEYRKKDGNTEQNYIARKEAAAGIVGKATGLTIGLQEFERQCEAKGWNIERRPNHRVIVTEDNIGAKVPEPVEMKNLLPDTHRSLNDLEEMGEAGGSEAHLVAYFNLLERMGFALDLAGTDETGEPLSQADLVKAVRDAKLEERFKDKQAELDAHYVYLITPREPNSEHRGDIPDPDQGDGYFYSGLSFVKLIILPRSFYDLLIHHYPTTDSTEELNTTLGDWLSMRGIQKTTKKQIELFVSAAHFTNNGKAELGNLFQLRLTPLQLHHITVPHVNGSAHIDWTTPDRRGHRFAISARSMSRYEPLIRWADNLPQPQISHQKDVPVKEIDNRRIMTKEDGVDLPVPLSVSNFPHPEQLRFAYTLPSAGVRSLLNRISLIRTGYRGCQLSFRYKLVDHDQPEELGWKKIIESITLDETSQKVSSPVIVPTPRSSTADVRLFRHERLITLEEIPYFYAVQLAVNGQFEGDLQGDPPRPDPMTVPEYSRRMPVVIAYRPPVVPESTPGADGSVYEIDIILTRLGEMASPAELAGGIPSEQTFLQEITGGFDFQDNGLPMPALGYHFYHRVQDDAEHSEPGSDSVYQSIVDLLMPWHEGYIKDDNNNGKPFVRSLNSDITVKPEDTYPSIKLRRLNDTKELVPVVSVRFTVNKNNLFSQPSQRYMQVSCLGKLTPATLLKVKSND
ncbi:MAG: hypothetical protein SD837_10340 [Candidatus Electrothrix scaldis]|nr:MAG: hypothetical protein SD837_10340 [Candidatus Electrothrix sp. GW3-3]